MYVTVRDVTKVYVLHAPTKVLGYSGARLRIRQLLGIALCARAIMSQPAIDHRKCVLTVALEEYVMIVLLFTAMSMPVLRCVERYRR